MFKPPLSNKEKSILRVVSPFKLLHILYKNAQQFFKLPTLINLVVLKITIFNVYNIMCNIIFNSDSNIQPSDEFK